MAITRNTYGEVVDDLSVGRIEIFTESDDPDAWPIVIHMQSALYDGNTRVSTATLVERHEFIYGQIKDQDLGNGMKLSAMFPQVKAAAYALRNLAASRPSPLPTMPETETLPLPPANTEPTSNT